MDKNALEGSFWAGPDIEEKFWARARQGEEADDCWEWEGNHSRQGYAKLHVTIVVHRYAYTLLVGPIPEGLQLLHSCDNPGCINPRHLRPGTQLENRQDCVVRGRTAKGDRSGRRLYPDRWENLLASIRGESNGNAKLTEEKVLEMRERYARGGVSQSQLAREYGVNQSVISRILTRKRWKHLRVE